MNLLGKTVLIKLGKQYVGTIIGVDKTADPVERRVHIRVFGQGSEPPFGDLNKMSVPYSDDLKDMHWSLLDADADYIPF